MNGCFQSIDATEKANHASVHLVDDPFLAGESNQEYECEDCSFKSTDLEVLNSHMKSHFCDNVVDLNNPKPKQTLRCNQCNFKSQDMSAFTKHLMLQVRREFHCVHCTHSG